MVCCANFVDSPATRLLANRQPNENVDTKSMSSFRSVIYISRVREIHGTWRELYALDLVDSRMKKRLSFCYYEQLLLTFNFIPFVLWAAAADNGLSPDEQRTLFIKSSIVAVVCGHIAFAGRWSTCNNNA